MKLVAFNIVDLFREVRNQHEIWITDIQVNQILFRKNFQIKQSVVSIWSDYERIFDIEPNIKSYDPGARTVYATDIGGDLHRVTYQFDAGVDTDSGADAWVCRKADMRDDGSNVDSLLDRWKNFAVYTEFVR